MYAVTKQQMKELEERCNRWGLDYRTLMENAGTAAGYLINDTIPVAGKNCMVFCGKGSNGGDGFVCARLLHSLGAHVQVVLALGEPTARLAQEMLVRVEELGVEVLELELDSPRVQELLSQVDIVVDALYGTGFHGALDEQAARACMTINSAIAAVFSLDLPSGTECDTPNGDIDCVKADFTIAFDSLKPSHILPPTGEQCGNVSVVDIGIPSELKEDLDYQYAIVDDKLVFDLVKVRPANSHKGDYGKLLNIAGSVGYPGAAVLSSLGALRCGVGYVELAAVESVLHIAAISMPEPIQIPLSQNAQGRIFARGALETLAPYLETASAIALGCGLGLDGDTCELVYEVLRRATCPVIVDADGINALCQNIDILHELSAAVVLTPHLGELSRLLGISVEELEGHLYERVGAFAKEYQVTVVCKGHRTFVALASGGIFQNTTGNAGLAKAGSGDLLTGIIGALAAQGIPPHLAAACGVYLHGRAADECAARLSQYYMQPTDVAESLAGVFLAYGR